jgi:hypothetical protein
MACLCVECGYVQDNDPACDCFNPPIQCDECERSSYGEDGTDGTGPYCCDRFIPAE